MASRGWFGSWAPSRSSVFEAFREAFREEFVDAETSEDFGYSLYSVREVHRIGILDLRIANWLPHVDSSALRKLGDVRLR